VSYETSTLQRLSYEGNIVASYMFIWTPDSKNIGIIHLGSCGDITGHKTLPRDTAQSLYNSLRKKGLSRVPTSHFLPCYTQTIDWLLERIA